MGAVTKNVTVFCSARDEIDTKYHKLAYEVGSEIAKLGHNVVTGASISGSMGKVAEGCADHDGVNIGVYPRELSHLEKPFPCDTMYYEQKLIDRQEKLIELGEAFVVLPGGSGTLYELMEVLTKIATGIIEPVPIIIVNQDHYYEGLIEQLLKMEQEGSFDLPESLYFVYNVEGVVEVLTEPAYV